MEILSLKNSKGILYHSAKDNSGYAESGKRVMYDLIKSGYALSWKPFIPNRDFIEDETDFYYQKLKSILNKNIDFDTAIFHCTPDSWFRYIEKFKIKFIGKKLIGYPTWETSKLPEIWVKYINMMDEIWVPCNFNKKTFLASGVEVPITVIPYPTIIDVLPEIKLEKIANLLNKAKLYSVNGECKPNCKIYYTIGEWNDRKNLDDTVRLFCKAFTKDDNVKLIIKTFHFDYLKPNVKHCFNKFENILKDFKDHPEILVIVEDLSYEEIQLLHAIGNCYVSMTRGEGFCLGAYDAHTYRKDIIITGYGGHLDYLGEEYPGLIQYDLVSVNFPERESLYSIDQQWANPNFKNALDKIKIKDVSNITQSIDFTIIDKKVSPAKEIKEIREINNIFAVDSTKNVEKENTELKIENSLSLKVQTNSEFKGILYFGQYGTCGYATAAKGNLCHFFMNGIPISWVPLYFDNSRLSSDCFYNAMATSLLNKPIDFYDTVILHSTPDLWFKFLKENEKKVDGKKIIGYTVWETSQLPNNWVGCINDCVDEVWCPSSYNKEVFINSGVTIPIRVFPHIFLEKTVPDKKSVLLNYSGKKEGIDDDYIFYNISELNARKGVEDLMNAFCGAFTADDKVKLLIKVHYKNYEDSNKEHCVSILNKIKLNYNNPPRIYYILDNLTEIELLGLHSIGDCYVSLCKSEGFGLTIFEAFKYGKKVITTGYGGQVDFLGKDYVGLVDYELGKVVGMENWYATYGGEWAYPNLEHAKNLMKYFYEQR